MLRHTTASVPQSPRHRSQLGLTPSRLLFSGEVPRFRSKLESEPDRLRGGWCKSTVRDAVDRIASELVEKVEIPSGKMQYGIKQYSDI